MTRKVSIHRRYTGPPPIARTGKRKGKPVPKNLWPQRRPHVWIVRWFAPAPDGTTVRPSRTFKSRADAEAFRSEKQAEFHRSPEDRRIVREVTLQEFADALLRRRVGSRGRRIQEKTVANYRSALNRFSGFVGENRALSSITHADCIAYGAHLHELSEQSSAKASARAISVATMNKDKSFLRSAFNIAVSQLGHIRKNPWQGIALDRVSETPIRYVTSKEFSAILDVCDDLERALWWRALLTVFYTVGLRYSEAIHLTMPDIDFEHDTIRVSPKPECRDTIKWQPKTYQLRIIPAPTQTMSLLAKLHEEAPTGHGYLFLPADRLAAIKRQKSLGQWHGMRSVLNNTVRSFRKIVRTAARSASSLADGSGRATASVHDLRRSCLTNWTKTVNMQTVMRMAGHSRIETTMRFYAATTDDQLMLIRKASEASLVRRKKIAQTSSPKSAITPYGIERYNLEGICANSGYNGKNYTNSPPSGPGLLVHFVCGSARKSWR